MPANRVVPGTRALGEQTSFRTHYKSEAEMCARVALLQAIYTK